MIGFDPFGNAFNKVYNFRWMPAALLFQISASYHNSPQSNNSVFIITETTISESTKKAVGMAKGHTI